MPRHGRIEIDWENANVPLLGTPHVEITPPSIFVKTTVSPWACITHSVLLTIRLLISIGMTAFLILHFVNEFQIGNPRLFPFLLGNLTWCGQCVYMWMAFYWTAISDRARTLPTESAEAFGTFYIMTTVLPLVSSMLHWVYVNPSYSLQPYRYTILHTMNVAIVLIEVLVLNSIAKPGIVWVHVCVLGVLTVLYCELWVVVGNVFSEMELREGWLDWRFFGGDKEMGRELTSGITWVGLLWVAACFYGVWTVEWYKDALMAAAERWERDEITRWVDGQRGAGTRLQAVSVVDRMSV